MIHVPRRAFLGGLATLPLASFAGFGCGSRPPETPLAHLYGKEWVRGSYELYAGKYNAVQEKADAKSFDAYRVLAQKGVVALDALQSRDVPFYIKVGEDGRAFSIERNVPERLMFTANMTDADRQAATEAWKKARDHIHTDYEEIRRLNWSLTELLKQLQLIRNAIDEGRVEQYRQVAQIQELKKGDKPPFELPYQVSQQDYVDNLHLLLERLEDDRHRLERIESDIVAVGLTVRATDAGSASLAANIQKVLLAVLEDSTAKPRPATYPAEERAKLLAEGQRLEQTIFASAEFKKWEKEEAAKKWEAIGQFLPLLDAVTGIPTSSIYRSVINMWKGDGDYLSYAKTLLQMSPVGKQVTSTLADAIDTTERARKIGGTVLATMKTGAPSADALAAQAKGVLLNTGTKFARDRIDKQLVFFKDKAELTKVSEALSETPLVKNALPAIPQG